MEEVVNKLKAYRKHYADCMPDRRLSGFYSHATFLLGINFAQTVKMVYDSSQHEPFNTAYGRYHFVMGILQELVFKVSESSLPKISLSHEASRPLIEDYHEVREMILGWPELSQEMTAALRAILDLEFLLITCLIDVDAILPPGLHLTTPTKQNETV